MTEKREKADCGPLIRFNREVTLGNLLQLGSFVVALFAMWASVDRRLTCVELRGTFATEEGREMRKSISALAENQTAVARAVDRMAVLLDEHTKKTRDAGNMAGGAK